MADKRQPGEKRSRSPSPSTSSNPREGERSGSSSPGSSTSSNSREVERFLSPSPEPSTSSNRRRVEMSSRSPSLPRLSSSFDQQSTAERPVACIEDVPPEIMEVILGYLSPPDVLALGATCSRFQQQSQSPWVWKRFCRPITDLSEPRDWQRLAILKYTQGVHMQRLDRCPQHSQASPFRAIDAPGAYGYRRVLPGRKCIVILDHQDTLHVLKEVPGQDKLGPPTVLCHDVVDFTFAPHRDCCTSICKYLYVLARSEDDVSSLRVYLPTTGELIYNGIFDSSVVFTQIQVTGPEFPRMMLLLSVTGVVYRFDYREIFLRMVILKNDLINIADMRPRILTSPYQRQPFHQVLSSHGSALYLTGDGIAFLEVFTKESHRTKFGKQLPFTMNSPVYLPTLNKVVKCWLGPGHLFLLDERGFLFTLGENCFGQLGTGDTDDRRTLTQVAVSMRPVDVWCGLDHTLVLMQSESGAMELHGCGLGVAGRLPGCRDFSLVLVKLDVQVPRATLSICATSKGLFLLTCHDIAEPLLADAGSEQ